MTVVFDAEPLLAFSFDERGATEVERWLDRVYDGERSGYVSTLDLAEFRYIAVRETSVERADAHIDSLREMGVTEYTVDGLWEDPSQLKATYSPSLGDAYAVATAVDLDSDDERVPSSSGATTTTTCSKPTGGSSTSSNASGTSPGNREKSGSGRDHHPTPRDTQYVLYRDAQYTPCEEPSPPCSPSRFCSRSCWLSSSA